MEDTFKWPPLADNIDANDMEELPLQVIEERKISISVHTCRGLGHFVGMSNISPLQYFVHFQFVLTLIHHFSIFCCFQETNLRL